MQDQAEGGSSVADRIAWALSERIVTGVLAPGMPVRQDHIAAEFRASHVPVREAFRKLEAQGLLVSEPRRGVKVAPLDPLTVLEVTEMRAALEVLALRYAFPQLGREALEAASRALEEGEASNEILIWERANRHFHQAITAPCGMPRLMGTIDSLHQTSARFLFSTWRELAWQSRSDSEHRQILTSLIDGKLDQATDALRAHILDAGKALAKRLQSV